MRNYLKVTVLGLEPLIGLDQAGWQDLLELCSLSVHAWLIKYFFRLVFGDLPSKTCRGGEWTTLDGVGHCICRAFLLSEGATS